MLDELYKNSDLIGRKQYLATLSPHRKVFLPQSVTLRLRRELSRTLAEVAQSH